MSNQQNDTEPTADRSRAEEAREPDEQPSTATATTTATGSQVGSEVESGSAAERKRESGTETVAGETEEQTRPEWVQYDFAGESKLSVHDLDVYYGDEHALKDVSMEIPEKSVTALIGPSGCGKSTYLRCLNRMNDRIKAARIEGAVELDGQNIYDDNTNLVELRKRIGMVFQSPNPFPKSIRDNISYGPRKHGDINTGILSKLLGRDDGDAEDELVERSLRNAALWSEVKDRLDDNALGLSGGQQQRLCIARCLATDPEVILMDEPASALDPIATSKIEDLITDLAEDYTVVVVTHNMQQAARISDQTAVFLTGGELVEYDDTEKIFENPESQRVEDYISGKFG